MKYWHDKEGRHGRQISLGNLDVGSDYGRVLGIYFDEESVIFKEQYANYFRIKFTPDQAIDALQEAIKWIMENRMSEEKKMLNRYGNSYHFFYNRKAFTRLCYNGLPAYWYELIDTPPIYGSPPIHHPIGQESDMWQELEEAYSVWKTHNSGAA